MKSDRVPGRTPRVWEEMMSRQGVPIGDWNATIQSEKYGNEKELERNFCAWRAFHFALRRIVFNLALRP